MLAGHGLHGPRDLEELVRAVDRGQLPVGPQDPGLLGDVEVVHHDERVRVEGDRVLLAVQPALGPHAVEEVGLLHAVLGQQVEVPGVEQAARRVSGDA